jgi:hypothetical protein
MIMVRRIRGGVILVHALARRERYRMISSCRARAPGNKGSLFSASCSIGFMSRDCRFLDTATLTPVFSLLPTL